MPDAKDIFGLCRAKPSEKSWNAIVAALDALPAAALPAAVERCASLLASWPVDVKLLPEPWRDAQARGEPCPQAALATAELARGPSGLDFRAFCVSRSGDVVLAHGYGYDYDLERDEVIDLEEWRLLGPGDASHTLMERRRDPDEDFGRPSPLLLLSPSGAWSVILDDVGLYVFRGQDPFLQRAHVRDEPPPHPHGYTVVQANFAAFGPHERWLVYWARVEGQLTTIDLRTGETIAQRPFQREWVRPWCFALLPGGTLLVRQRWFNLHHLKLPGLRKAATLTVALQERYPGLDACCTGDGTLVSLAPHSDVWYDLQDQGFVYGGVYAAARSGAKFVPRDDDHHEFLSGPYWETPQAWDMRATETRAGVVYVVDHERLRWVSLPSTTARELRLSTYQRAFCLAPDCESLYLARGNRLIRVWRTRHASAADERRAEVFRTLLALTERGGSQWAWNKLVKQLGALETDADRARAVATLAPRLEGWYASERIPPRAWRGDSPLLQLTPVRVAMRFAGYGTLGFARHGRDDGTYVFTECEVDKARFGTTTGARAKPTIWLEVKAEREGVILEPGDIAVSDDGRWTVAALTHADHRRYCDLSDVSPIGGGQQLFVWRDGALIGRIQDRFVKTGDRVDNRVHNVFTTNRSFTTLYTWMVGQGDLRRVNMATMEVEAATPRRRVFDMDLSPDGRLLVVASYPDTELLDARTLAPLQTITVDDEPRPAARACFDASGRLLVLVQAGPRLGSLRRGALDLTITILRVHKRGAALTEEVRHAVRLPGSEHVTNTLYDNTPQVGLRLARRGDRVVLLWWIENDSQLGVIELPGMRQATLKTHMNYGFVGFSRDREEVLYTYERDLLRWRPPYEDDL